MRVKIFVVAVSSQEAREIADEHGHTSRADAESHLKDVKAPPTDPFYAAQYKIYVVERAS